MPRSRPKRSPKSTSAKAIKATKATKTTKTTKTTKVDDEPFDGVEYKKRMLEAVVRVRESKSLEEKRRRNQELEVVMSQGPGYGSIDRDADPDAILRACTYHRRDFDLVVVRTRPDEMELLRWPEPGLIREPTKPLKNSIILPIETRLGDGGSIERVFHRQSKADLGKFEGLPLPVMKKILRYLDVQSYFRFRQVNKMARQYATAKNSKYRAVVKYGLEAYRGLLRGGLGHRYTIEDLYNELTQPSCRICGRFGGFVFLLRMIRVCWACLRTSQDLSVMAMTTLIIQAGDDIDRKVMEDVLGPVALWTVEGVYSLTQVPARRPARVIDMKQVFDILREKGLLTRTVETNLEDRVDLETFRFMATTPLPWYDVTTNRLERGVSCKGCAMHRDNVRSTVENPGLVFSKVEYLNHIKWACIAANVIWTTTDRGKQPGLCPETEFLRDCGYFPLHDELGRLR